MSEDTAQQGSNNSSSSGGGIRLATKTTGPIIEV